jgi:hypothetical protein
MMEQGILPVMRCQFCGNIIGMYRKLTDSEFCSADHRQQHELEQQQFLMDRLRTAAVRVQLSRDRFMTRRTAAIAPADPGPAPFLLPSPGPVAGVVRLAACSTLQAAVDLFIPEFLVTRTPGPPLAGFQPNLPWPCQNASLRAFPSFGAAGQGGAGTEYLQATARVFAAWQPLPYGPSPQQLTVS